MQVDEQVRTECASATSPLLRHEARTYALRQLARRACVSSEMFDSWEVRHESDHTLVYLDRESRKILRIPHANGQLLFRNSQGKVPVAKTFVVTPGNGRDRELPVPFVSACGSGPLFTISGADQIDCRVDVLASILLSLSRFEETLPVEHDIHGRFPSTASVAVQHGFSDRPIVDEYGVALEHALRAVLPSWRPCPRELRVKLSHDIDRVGIPFRIKPTVGHLIKRRRPGAALRDLAASVSNVSPGYLQSVESVIEMSRQYGVQSAVYWKACDPGPWDDGYDVRNKKVVQVIQEFEARGIENGVHPGYETYLQPDRLAEEVARLKALLPNPSLGGRQHYLRWSPQTWIDWENCGLAYDSTVGYSDRAGFRAGTCFPYRPWILSLNREADLLEVPLIVMDNVLLSIEEPIETVRKLVDECKRVGGVFTLLWHNESLLGTKLGRLYEPLLRLLAGCPNFDCGLAVTNSYM